MGQLQGNHSNCLRWPYGFHEWFAGKEDILAKENPTLPQPPTALAQIKTELLLRILLQNLTLMAAAVGFAALAALMVVVPVQAWVIAAIHAATSLALVLQWCHHGVRTMQIKQFITLHEAGAPTSWEAWLPANRPKRLLGTRWMISTKGVFLGLQLAMAVLATMLSPQIPGLLAGISAAIFAASVGFLMTNPKE